MRGKRCSLRVLWALGLCLATTQAVWAQPAIGIGAPDIVLPDANDGGVAEAESLALGPAFDLEDGL